MKKTKLCLGTAKLGDPNYGFSSSHQPSHYTDVLSESVRLGIHSFDTSPRYNDSEIKLGKYFSKKSYRPFISTKIDNLNIGNRNTPSEMIESVMKSIENLKVDFIDLCYLHQNNIEIISDKYVHEGMNILKDMGLIKESGTSIYSNQELTYTMETQFFDWVQVPVNILDISFYNKIVSYNMPIKIAARSVFLQGIMFDEASIKKYIPDCEEMVSAVKKITDIAMEHNKDFKTLCVEYLFNLEHISMIIFGSTSIENINFFEQCCSQKLSDELLMKINLISSKQKEWTNPRNWPELN